MFLLTYGKDFNWISFSFIFGLTGVISVGANLIGSKHFIKYALKHELNVTTEGLKIKDADSYTVLPWGNVIQRETKFEIWSSVKAFYTSEGFIDLTCYEQLDKLALEIKSFIEAELWK